MDKLDRYRQIILDVLEEYSKLRPPGDEIEVYKAIDRQGDHYQILRDGWRNNRRFYGCVLHFDIKDDKIWIRHDGTEDGIAKELIERGVAREDLVFAYHGPAMRDLVTI